MEELIFRSTSNCSVELMQYNRDSFWDGYHCYAVRTLFKHGDQEILHRGQGEISAPFVVSSLCTLWFISC